MLIYADHQWCADLHLNRADFAFWDVAMRRRQVIDAKGVVTPLLRVKQERMKARHGLEVEKVVSANFCAPSEAQCCEA